MIASRRIAQLDSSVPFGFSEGWHSGMPGFPTPKWRRFIAGSEATHLELHSAKPRHPAVLCLVFLSGNINYQQTGAPFSHGHWSGKVLRRLDEAHVFGSSVSDAADPSESVD